MRMSKGDAVLVALSAAVVVAHIAIGSLVVAWLLAGITLIFALEAEGLI